MIDQELNRVFNEIHQNALLHEENRQEQLMNLSWVMSELNMIHPFREGNGRSIRELVRCMALEYGLLINWGNTDKEILYNAAIASVTDSRAFYQVLEQCIS